MNKDKRNIIQENEDKIIAFRPRVTNFNELVSDYTKQGGLINYVSAKTGIDKAYVASYVAEVYSKMDGFRGCDDEDVLTIDDYEEAGDILEEVISE